MGAAAPGRYGGIFCSLFVGAQFPAFNFIIAEMILALSMCVEIDWCAITDAPSLLQIKEILGVANVSSCPAVSYGIEPPFYTDAALCYELLRDNAFELIWVFIALMVGVGVLTYGMSKLFAVVCEKFKCTLRVEMFGNILKQDIGYFDDEAHSTGAMASRLAADTTLVAGGFGQGYAMIYQAMTSTLLALIFGFIYNWQLTLALLAIMPINAVGMGAAMSATGFTTAAQTKAATATAIATEAISGYRTVATFQMQEHVTELFEGEMQSSTGQATKQVVVTSLLYGVLGLGMQFGTNAIAFAYGGYLVKQGHYTADDIMKTFLLVQGIGMGIGACKCSFMLELLLGWNQLNYACVRACVCSDGHGLCP